MIRYFLFLLIPLLASCGGSSSENKTLQTVGVTNFTGTWSLSRVNYSTTGINVDCTAKEFTVVQEDTKVIVGTRSYTCGNFAYASSEMEYEVSGNKLTFVGRDAGEIGPNYIHIRLNNDDRSSQSLSLDSYDDRTTLRESSATSLENSYFIITAVINRTP